MRYFVIAVAIGAFWYLTWVAANLFVNGPPHLSGFVVPLTILAVTIALAAAGLIMGRVWGAYLLGVVASVCSVGSAAVLFFAWALDGISPQDTTRGDPAIPIAFGALVVAVVVAVTAFSLGRSMSRLERAAPE
jgi:hypothetical protein